MRKCNKCQISYTGNIKRCPLCQGELIGKKTPSPFPKKKIYYIRFYCLYRFL